MNLELLKNPKLLAPFLIATAMTAAVTGKTNEVLKAYTLKTPTGDLAIQADSNQHAFQLAVNTVAENIKDDTTFIPVTSKTFVVDSAVQDDTGTTIGTCNIVAYNDEFNIEAGQNNFHYKALCWDGTNADSAVFPQPSPIR